MDVNVALRYKEAEYEQECFLRGCAEHHVYQAPLAVGHPPLPPHARQALPQQLASGLHSGPNTSLPTRDWGCRRTGRAMEGGQSQNSSLLTSCAHSGRAGIVRRMCLYWLRRETRQSFQVVQIY